MKLPGRKKLRFAARWARSRVGSRGLILAYHRVADETWDPFSLSVSRRHFAEHLEAIRRLGVPTRLKALARSLAAGEVVHRAIALTFDDGYGDMLQTVAPLLEQHGVPATVFVVSGNIGREFWWDELARILSPVRPSGVESPVEIVVGDGGPSLRLTRDPEDSVREVQELQRLLQPMHPNERERLLERIRSAVGAHPGAANGPEHRCLDGEELVRLARRELVDVGGHTHSHVELGRLSAAQQESEIAECKRVLEDLVGEGLQAFSYPHGSTPRASREALERLGFLAGCTSVPDVVRRGTDRLLLPRVWVSDVDGETLSRQLLGWLGNR